MEGESHDQSTIECHQRQQLSRVERVTFHSERTRTHGGGGGGLESLDRTELWVWHEIELPSQPV
ncbi:hypothetical protein Mapa_014131 [Marchantia paleacea]|nr:hypothetical protein Mapa_014131 [Marchantia paleacea]